MIYVRTEAPAELPVSREELKLHLKIEVDDVLEDTLLDTYLAAAVDHLDGRTGILGRCLLIQEWQAYADATAPCATGLGFVLDLPPIADVLAVEVRTAGSWTAIADTRWRDTPLAGGRVLVMPALGLSWPASDPGPGNWRITFAAGVEAAEDVPAAIRAAILLLAADMHADRSGKTVANLVENATIGRLLGPHTVMSV